MNLNRHTQDTGGGPGTATPIPGTVILGETEGGIVDETAITLSALLAELEEADGPTLTPSGETES